jgi:hypothetical protein
MKVYQIPEDILSDRNSTFTGCFFPDLYNYLEIKDSLSTANHPYTVGKTETRNQLIECCFRAYCNYAQNDWASLFAMVQYTYNNSIQSATKMSPFYDNYALNHQNNWPLEVQFRNPASDLHPH